MNEYITNKYLTKDQLRYRVKAADFNAYWADIEKQRLENSIKLPLLDKEKRNLYYNLTEETIQNINQIEELAKKANIEDIIPDDIKSSSLVETLIDEAFSSSVIEGAHSTRKRAMEMILNQEAPVNKSEKMILNNYTTLKYTMDNIDRDIDHDYIIDIWKMLTINTLDKEDITTGYRDRDVFVKSSESIIYQGPEPKDVIPMMDSLTNYINSIEDINPIIKSCIIHYYFVYVHPFIDGNGRTARALMNLYLIKYEMDFFKYFSISKILTEKRSAYYKAIKCSEDFGSDLTYFIDFYSKLLLDTIKSIKQSYVNTYGQKLVFDTLVDKNIIINDREEKLITSLLKGKRLIIDVKDYTKMMKVVQETGRKDLDNLYNIGILSKIKRGNKYIYKLNKIEDITRILSEYS